MSNADIYIQKFKELESVVKETFGLNDWDSITNFLSKRDEYRPYREEIKYCQEVRNLLQHKQKIDDEYPVQPTEEMIEFLQSTIDSLKNRKKCGEIMVPMRKMREIPSGHVPILDEKGRVTGVFTANAFLWMMADRKGEPIEKDCSFEDAEKYVAFDSHDSEVYRFVSRKLYVDELRDIFEKIYSGGKRLAMVFVTENGKENEKLLGTISPWDVLGKGND